MFVTNDPELYEQVLCLNNHGRSRAQKKQFWADTHVATNSKCQMCKQLSVCAQLSRVDELVAKKQEILTYYRSRMSDLPFIALNSNHSENISGAWMPNIVFLNPRTCRANNY